MISLFQTEYLHQRRVITIYIYSPTNFYTEKIDTIAPTFLAKSNKMELFKLFRNILSVIFHLRYKI